MPVLVTEPKGMEQVRGMRMGYAPLLALLEPAIAKGYKRLAVIGIPCQVYALRALEKELGLERLYVIGTPCSDNTTTENFHTFLELLAEDPDTITYLAIATRFLPPDLSHLCGLHQCFERHNRGLYGRTGSAMAAGEE